MANRIQLRRDTTSNWNSVNPVLADGEPGYDIVTNEIRIGNGSNTWSQLSANTISGGSGTSLTNNGYTFSLETNGNLTLPQGGTITEANVGLADALILTPANVSYPGQQLRIYSTGNVVEGNHLHLTTGNLYASELYLGDDNYYVKLADTGNVQIRATTQSLSSTALWDFDPSGNLTMPTNGDVIMPGTNSILSAGGTTLLGGYSQVAGYYSTLGISYTGAGTQHGMTLQPAADNTTAINFLNASGNSVGNITQTSSTVKFTGDGSGLSNVAIKTTGSWTVTIGSANYSFTVPQNGTYTMWVRGNIPNGIIVWNATATVTNNNVPVIGQQYAWNYNSVIPMPLEITALPVQFIGTANTIISSNTYGGGPSNTFTFTVNNASGSPQTVYWGYVAQ
jgi:hypothetical protein